MRLDQILLWMMLFTGAPAHSQLSVGIGIGMPGISIGINLPLYPELVPVPGYPVYYAPRLNTNYFFYDGMYWVYQGDNWYASSWYNGPWGLVGPEVVPLYVLRIPVRYYRAPPGYFRGWQGDAPPRWNEHWGNEWQQRRSGWERWDRGTVPAPAPLPVYQRQFTGNRYPQIEQQRTIHSQNYRYQPQNAVVREHYQTQAAQRPAQPAPAARDTPDRNPRQQPTQPQPQPQPAPQAPPQAGPGTPRPQRGNDEPPRSAPQQQAPAPAAQEQRRPEMQPPQAPQSRQAPPQREQREQQAPRANQDSAPQNRGPSQEPRRGQDKDRDRGDERGQDRNK